jgi:uncharacterized protein Yka (UPF0111/DUF47 family)
MEKAQAVEALGQRRLMLPSWVKAALSANDRLKVYLTVLQAAASHALHPDRDPPDLAQEISAAGLTVSWLRDTAGAARAVNGDIVIPDLPRLRKCFLDDLVDMARPVLETAASVADLRSRVQYWIEQLGALSADRLSLTQIESLTQGRRGGADSLHLLVMDLHKQINLLAAELASEVIDGAKVWDLQPDDRTLVAAFMRGLNRTAGLKFDHPGLDTAATRDGARLLLQNDIGTNDAHVLVIQVEALHITLTYSDLHRKRLKFFQASLQPFGAQWSAPTSRTDRDLNSGAAYVVANAQFDCSDQHELEAALEGIGSRIVFLIDWNHARKRLQAFLSKPDAIAVLAEAARLDIGHRAWLQVGAERLIYSAMQSAGDGAFRIGERLDEVMGASDARAFLLAVMRRARDALRGGQPPALVVDETRMLLARHVRHRTNEFDLLTEHVSYCHALAQAVSDGLAHGVEGSIVGARELASRAKEWERKADHLVMQAREKAERQPRWRPVVKLAEQFDDVADALEEASFLLGLIADHHLEGWNAEVRQILGQLAATVLQATQEHVKAVALARTLGADSETVDNEAFLEATWHVLQAERRCDSLLRDARRSILGAIADAPSLMLANDLAGALESTSDRLLTAAYGLREVAFDRAGVTQ